MSRSLLTSVSRRLAPGRLLLCALFAFTLHAQETGRRIALIIGNDTYSISPLRNAVNDARLMDKALKAAGFQTIPAENVKKAEMDRLVGEFLDKIGPDDTALFFYAGHGVQIENENFLVPVDFAPAATISAAKFACMSVAQIFDELKRKRAKRNIVILDACRTNPVAKRYSLEGGLAKPQDAPKETFIAFSTSPGQTAADNPDGRDSWFTESLGGFVGQSTPIEINEMFTRVRKHVSDSTEGRQTPWTTSSLTTSFYFHPPAGGETAADMSALEKWFSDAHAREAVGQWAQASDLIDRILQKKPGGEIEAAARKKQAYLTLRRDAQTRYDAGDYAGAAALDLQALKLDPFAMSAALDGANSNMLADRGPEAIELLKNMRTRGTSQDAETATRMLKQLGAAFPDAKQAAESAAPAPPPIEEVFADFHLGPPDPDSGKRYLAGAPVDLGRSTRDLKMEAPPPVLVLAAMHAAAAAAATLDATAAAPTETPDPQTAALLNAVFHLEVVPTAETSRNLRIRTPDTPQDFGFVNFNGPGSNTPVVFDGKPIMLPAKLRLPAGKYEVRTVDAGKVVNKQELEVAPQSTQSYEVKHP